jgi:hypothetical protein
VLISTTVPPLDNVASSSSPLSLPVSDEIDETLPYEQDYYGDDLVADREHQLLEPDQSHQQHQQTKEIPTLQDMCQRIMSSSLNFKNILAALTFAEKYSLSLLFSYCLKFIAK